MSMRRDLFVTGFFLLCVGQAVQAETLDVVFELAPPQIISQQVVRISGTTNLPAETRVVIRTDLTARPDQIPPVTGRRISAQGASGPAGAAVVTANGTFELRLREPHKFKTGTYRIAAQVFVCSYTLLGSSTPQPTSFYEIAGKHGENLRGTAIDKQGDFLSTHVAVFATDEVALRPEEVDAFAKRERVRIGQCLQEIDGAYQQHLQLRERGMYARSTQTNEWLANRVVAGFTGTMKQLDRQFQYVQTQEAFFQLQETLKTLEQVHYWALQAERKPAEYAQAQADFAATRTRLQDYLDGIK